MAIAWRSGAVIHKKLSYQSVTLIIRQVILIRTFTCIILLSSILLSPLFIPQNSFAQEQGQLFWEFVMDDNVASNSPAVVDGIVYITSYTAVFAVDKSTGEEIWSAGLNGNPVSDSPQIVDEVLYIADQRRIVYALDIQRAGYLDQGQRRNKHLVACQNHCLW